MRRPEEPERRSDGPPQEGRGAGGLQEDTDSLTSAHTAADISRLTCLTLLALPEGLQLAQGQQAVELAVCSSIVLHPQGGLDWVQHHLLTAGGREGALERRNLPRRGQDRNHVELRALSGQDRGRSQSCGDPRGWRSRSRAETGSTPVHMRKLAQDLPVGVEEALALPGGSGTGWGGGVPPSQAWGTV